VFHFTKSSSIKFNPDAVSAPSDDVFEYSPDNPKSESGSGLSGSGTRKNPHTGMARPSHVIEVAAESGQGDHSAPYPGALVEFFIKAFSDAGDSVYDGFTGSGTSIASAHVLNRVGLGCEIAPVYCDVALRRSANLTGEDPVLAATGQTMAQVAQSRGVHVNQSANPKQQHTRRIRRNEPAPFYGSKQKVG
jgi:DNA modification methylase